MKQILSLILCGFLLLALCACSLARSRDAQTEPAPETALPDGGNAQKGF